MTKTLTAADLTQFTGAESYYRHHLNRSVVYTEGVHYVAEHGGAFWLLDEIALTQRGHARIAAMRLQVWRLTVNPDKTARLTCEAGNHKVVFEKALTFTDFPLPEIVLWFANNTIYLPSEH